MKKDLCRENATKTSQDLTVYTHASTRTWIFHHSTTAYVKNTIVILMQYGS